jgi:hypothetical protein
MLVYSKHKPSFFFFFFLEKYTRSAQIVVPLCKQAISVEGQESVVTDYILKVSTTHYRKIEKKRRNIHD